MKQLPLDILAQPVFSFDNFLPGPNDWALAQLRAWVPQAGPEGSPHWPAQAPIYLWGPSGSGKSHLLHAMAEACMARGLRVSAFSAATPLPWEEEAECSLVLLDDCELLDDARQHAAFVLFVNAVTRGAQVMAAGRLPPVDLPLREDLRSRLGWGHIVPLQPLDEAPMRAALRREADRRGVFLSDEVLDYLLTHFARDLQHLMGLLARLDAFALTHKRALTLPLLRKMLNEEDLP
jgi:DnaA family protein